MNVKRAPTAPLEARLLDGCVQKFSRHRKQHKNVLTVFYFTDSALATVASELAKRPR